MVYFYVIIRKNDTNKNRTKVKCKKKKIRTKNEIKI